jgi:hypothetical protein
MAKAPKADVTEIVEDAVVETAPQVEETPAVHTDEEVKPTAKPSTKKFGKMTIETF